MRTGVEEIGATIDASKDVDTVAIDQRVASGEHGFEAGHIFPEGFFAARFIGVPGFSHLQRERSREEVMPFGSSGYAANWSTRYPLRRPIMLRKKVKIF